MLSALVVNQILNLNACSCSIKSISVSLLLYLVNVINQLAISYINSRQGSTILAASSNPQPLLTKQLTYFYYSCIDLYKTNIYNIIIIANYFSVYTIRFNYLLSALIPNTTILLINVLIYLLLPKIQFNNNNINCIIQPSNASSYFLSSLLLLLSLLVVILLNQSSSLSYSIILLIFSMHIYCLALIQYSSCLLSTSSLLLLGIIIGSLQVC